VPYLLDTGWVIGYLAGEEGAADLINSAERSGDGDMLRRPSRVRGHARSAAVVVPV
jgi:hypothetical protein